LPLHVAHMDCGSHYSIKSLYQLSADTHATLEASTTALAACPPPSQCHPHTTLYTGSKHTPDKVIMHSAQRTVPYTPTAAAARSRLQCMHMCTAPACTHTPHLHAASDDRTRVGLHPPTLPPTPSSQAPPAPYTTLTAKGTQDACWSPHLLQRPSAPGRLCDAPSRPNPTVACLKECV
jgi:hypothetical protein